MPPILACLALLAVMTANDPVDTAAAVVSPATQPATQPAGPSSDDLDVAEEDDGPANAEAQTATLTPSTRPTTAPATRPTAATAAPADGDDQRPGGTAGPATVVPTTQTATRAQLPAPAAAAPTARGAVEPAGRASGSPEPEQVAADDRAAIAIGVGFLALLAALAGGTWVLHRRLAQVQDAILAAVEARASFTNSGTVARAGEALDRLPADVPTRRERPADTHVPKVVVSRDVLAALADGTNEFRRTSSAETGYALVGSVGGRGPDRKIVIRGVIDAGPRAEYRPAMVRFDRDYQAAELRLLQLVDPAVGHAGDYHLHPGSLNECSAGDYRTDAANARESAWGEMIFVIATAVGSGDYGGNGNGHSDRGHRGAADEPWLLVKGLRLNFFYLGRASNYRYVRVRPDVVDEPMLRVPPGLRPWATAADVRRAEMDLRCLRSLPGVRATLGEVSFGGETTPCVTVRRTADSDHGGRGWQALMLLSPAAPGGVAVYVLDAAGEPVAFAPAFVEQAGGHVWLTEIALEIDRRLGRAAAPKDREGRLAGDLVRDEAAWA